MRVIRQPEAARGAWSAGDLVRGRGVRAAARPTIGGRHPTGPRPLAGSVGAPSGAEIGHRCRPNEQKHWPQANSNAGNRQSLCFEERRQTDFRQRAVSEIPQGETGHRTSERGFPSSGDADGGKLAPSLWVARACIKSQEKCLAHLSCRQPPRYRPHHGRCSHHRGVHLTPPG